MTVYLIRHGQTAWNIERRFLGRTDVPLDETGLAQAAALGAALGPFERLWSSPSARAMQTAAQLGEPVPHPGLLEMDMGELEGLDGPSFARNYPHLLGAWREDPSTVVIPGGETLAQTQARIVQAWHDIVAEAAAGAHDRIAIVTHQLALGSLLCALSNRPLPDFRDFTHVNTAYTVVRLTNGVPVIEAVNQAHHLA